ncbi:MAG: type II toxin-antitoxin system HipA family toxin [Paludibacteraceae bacterium]|nr:type II toxin-antitoxin system HipA family toxin [Paludibacteraceae bacterium]
MNNDIAVVKIWDMTVGYVQNIQNRIIFKYDPSFIKQGIELSPLMVPLNSRVYSFPNLNQDTFKGLPGFIADALPDKFGTSVLNQWLNKQGRKDGSYTVIERLLFQGTRAMGALEFEPELRNFKKSKDKIIIEDLVKAAADVLLSKSSLETNINDGEDALDMILKVGVSAGGSRPKAIVAYNKNTGEILSGLNTPPNGFDQYLLKLDVKINEEGLRSGSSHYCQLEHSYYKMALACGIEMEECLLVDSGERSHFLTKRFDREIKNGIEDKVHMVSLTGMAHYDFNIPRECSYEQMFMVMGTLNLPYHDMEQAFRRMVFNVAACNNDDHPKNISFLLDKNTNKWRLSPAYDLTYAYKKGNYYLDNHQMTINGKSQTEQILRSDLKEIGESYGIKNPLKIVDDVVDKVSHLEDYLDVRIPDEVVSKIKTQLNISCKGISNLLYKENTLNDEALKVINKIKANEKLLENIFSKNEFKRFDLLGFGDKNSFSVTIPATFSKEAIDVIKEYTTLLGGKFLDAKIKDEKGRMTSAIISFEETAKLPAEICKKIIMGETTDEILNSIKKTLEESKKQKQSEVKNKKKRGLGI